MELEQRDKENRRPEPEQGSAVGERSFSSLSGLDSASSVEWSDEVQGDRDCDRMERMYDSWADEVEEMDTREDGEVNTDDLLFDEGEILGEEVNE